MVSDNYVHALLWKLVTDAKCRTPLHWHRLYTDMLYNTTNGRARNNSTTCCTTNLPHRNARAQHLDMGCGKFLSVGGEFVVQQVVELLWTPPLVVLYNMSVASVHVVEFGTKRQGEHLPLTEVFWDVGSTQAQQQRWDGPPPAFQLWTHHHYQKPTHN